MFFRQSRAVRRLVATQAGAVGAVGGGYLVAWLLVASGAGWSPAAAWAWAAASAAAAATATVGGLWAARLHGALRARLAAPATPGGGEDLAAELPDPGSLAGLVLTAVVGAGPAGMRVEDVVDRLEQARTWVTVDQVRPVLARLVGDKLLEVDGGRYRRTPLPAAAGRDMYRRVAVPPAGGRIDARRTYSRRRVPPYPYDVSAAADVPAAEVAANRLLAGLVVDVVAASREEGLSHLMIRDRLAAQGQPVDSADLGETLSDLVDAGELVQAYPPYGRYRHPAHARAAGR